MGSTETAALPTLDIGLPGWTLRPWRASDAAALAQHANDTEVWRWMSDSFPHPYTPEIARHWCTRGHIDFGGDNWAIALDDQALGGCGIHAGAGQFRCNAEIGWWLARPYWGRGVVSRVAALLVQRAFDNPAITRVFAPIHAGNGRSMSVARKAGLSLESVQRLSAMKAGQPVDRHVFARYRDTA